MVGGQAHIFLLLRGFPDSEWELVVQDMTQKMPSFWKGTIKCDFVCAFRGEGGLSGTEAFVTSSKLLTVFHSQVPRV